VSIFPQVLRGKDRRDDRLSAVSRCYQAHGSTFYFTVGKTVRLSIGEPLLIKDILIANSDAYAKPLHIRALGILGDGVFASSGRIWAPQRELFNGSFHTKEVKVPQLSPLVQFLILIFTLMIFLFFC
jgi:hypothetical protein